MKLSSPGRGLDLRENVPLAPLTTFGIGGAARFYTQVEGVEPLRAALSWARRESIPLFVLGGGSNLVVSDAGFDGLVLHVGLRGIESRSEGSHVLLRAAAGESWDALVALAVGQGLGGFECLSGIPGYVGATPIQNVGAYGQDVSESIVEVESVDRATGELRRFSNDDCRFDYRDSIFKREAKEESILTAVTYRLRSGASPVIRYPDLRRHFDEAGRRDPTLEEVREGVLAIRTGKGMVVRPDDPDSRSAGSFFMNPLVDAHEIESIIGRASRHLPPERLASMPRFEGSRGRVKLSAAWLIESAGFSRGYRRENVGISSKHTLALVNLGGGSARQLLALVEEIRHRVIDVFGIELHPEPNFVGF